MEHIITQIAHRSHRPGAFWETLSPREQSRLLQLLVERVDYDGTAETISVTLRPTGIQTFSEREENVA